jgi:hypothetical protein
MVVVSLVLGLVIGSLATHFLWKPSPPARPSRSAYLVNQLDVAALLQDCKPADAKFLVSPAGSAEEDRYGFHGFYTASWTDTKDAVAVSGVLEKRLQGFVDGKGYYFARAGLNESLGGPDFQESMSQFEYHHPDWSVGGTIFVWIRHEPAHKWTVVVSYYAAHDPAR